MKSFKSILLSSRGFSLVEVVMAIGFMGIAALGVVSLTDQINGHTKRSEAMIDMSEFRGLLGRHFNSELGCLDLKDINISPTEDRYSGTYLRNLKGLVDKNGRDIDALGGGVEFREFHVADIGSYYKNLTEAPTLPGSTLKQTNAIVRVRVVSGPLPPPKSIKSAVGPPVSYYYDPNAPLGGSLSPGQRHFTYFFSIPVLVDPANLNSVERCGNESSPQSALAASKACLPKGNYQVLSCTGGSSCDESKGKTIPNPLTGEENCPAPSDRLKIGERKWNSGASGSIKNTLTYYMCLDCPEGLAGSDTSESESVSPDDDLSPGDGGGPTQTSGCEAGSIKWEDINVNTAFCSAQVLSGEIGEERVLLGPGGSVPVDDTGTPNLSGPGQASYQSYAKVKCQDNKWEITDWCCNRGFLYTGDEVLCPPVVP